MVKTFSEVVGFMVPAFPLMAVPKGRSINVRLEPIRSEFSG
jgi:hypothetical protein